ncbi:hypothetical protein PAMA_007352 [Pampus argenteus]
MSAAEDDTELRDLLIQNLENSGVLNKLKAEMRAAVFLAMEEQDRLENKTPLINENLKKCLNSKDGRLVASLIVDFLQVFNLDFSLAVFQPEINSLNGLDSRDLVCRDLGLSESELNRNSPLLLELVRRGRHKDETSVCTEVTAQTPTAELSQKQITSARKKFDLHDKDRIGSVLKEDLKSVFTDLFPSLNKNMLEMFITDELRAADKTFNKTIDFQEFLGLYKRLFTQCRSVVVQDSDVDLPQVQFLEGKMSSPPVSKGSSSSSLRRDCLDLEVEDDHEDGDSFFDDPLPKPQKTYGCRSSPLRDSSERTNSQNEKVETLPPSRARESPAGSLSETRGGAGGAESCTTEPSHSRNASNSREKRLGDSTALNERAGSLHLDDDVEYDDDFNSHRSDLSKSELSIGEEIEEVSIEGPDNSDKFDETTQDLSVSQLSQSRGVDYMEEVA